MPQTRTCDELREIFRQITLTLGGIFAVYEANDELMWTVTRELRLIFAAHLEALPEERGHASRPRPHPAVIELLASLDRPVAGRRIEPTAPGESSPLPGSDLLFRGPGA